MQAAGDAGAAGASEGRQGQRFVGRRGRHCQRGGLWKAEELVGSGELRRLAKGHLRDRRVDEGVFRRGGRGVEELGGQEDALLGDGQEEEVGGCFMEQRSDEDEVRLAVLSRRRGRGPRRCGRRRGGGGGGGGRSPTGVGEGWSCRRQIVFEKKKPWVGNRFSKSSLFHLSPLIYSLSRPPHRLSRVNVSSEGVCRKKRDEEKKEGGAETRHHGGTFFSPGEKKVPQLLSMNRK